MKIANLLIGTDPEVFVINKQTKEIESAIDLIPGNKDFPFPISDTGHAIQTDNVMAEFCVPPANEPVALYQSIKYCLDTINQMLPENLETVVQASAKLHEKFLNNEQAQTFGCDPDYNAYSLQQNEAPNSNTNLRTAGGHIHIGYSESNLDTNIEIIRALDLFLGLPSLILDTDTERRKMYGKAGAFREKSYGVEYRTLSNFWIKSEETVKWAFDQVLIAVNFINKGFQISDEEQVEIQLAINNQDVPLAYKYINKYNIKFVNNHVKELV